MSSNVPRFKLGDKTFTVRFRHFFAGTGYGEGTMCLLTQEGKDIPEITAMARLYATDRFCRRIGRIESFKKAMEKIPDRETRKQAWAAMREAGVRMV